MKAWKLGEKAKAQALFPLTDDQLASFFDKLEHRLDANGCRHDTRQAQAVIDAMALSDPEANALLDWCCEHGGYCDCEIAANSQQHWLENRAHRE